ncbi:MAG TPA: hypothetical protein VH413_05730 [Verrucomicrobiae bacterium]|jgi:hypothetical protein|nr:hypothetical protein [Verrucomicrobiae bacterium]
MQRFLHLKISVLLAVASLFAAGCATQNTIAARKQARPAAYDALTPEMRAAVDAGQVKVGMSMDGVMIAWGKPSQVLSGGNSAGESVTWIYQGSYIQDTRSWGRFRMYDSYTPITYVRAQVVFVNGVAKDWQQFPAPSGY